MEPVLQVGETFQMLGYAPATVIAKGHRINPITELEAPVIYAFGHQSERTYVYFTQYVLANLMFGQSYPYWDLP